MPILIDTHGVTQLENPDNKKGLHLCNPMIFKPYMATFVDTYRTVCIAPGPDARAALEAIQKSIVSV
jgi:hypothetical protein